VVENALRGMVDMILKQYLAELKKIQLLDSDEEYRLWQGYKDNGDLECRRQIIECYQPLVFKIAMSWQISEPVILDMIQEGTVGLIEAAENYDYTRGVAFSIYALHRIRGRMLNYLQREGKNKLAYIDSPLEGEDAGTLGDALKDTAWEVSRQVEHNYLIEQVRNALERLPAKEQLVLNGVYIEDREPKQVAEDLNVSTSHLYRLQKQGIRRIRGMLSKFMHNW
jgi:RNA polymerase sporulation-specific sigma factor